MVAGELKGEAPFQKYVLPKTKCENWKKVYTGCESFQIVRYTVMNVLLTMDCQSQIVLEYKCVM